jgi:NAD+ synthase
MNMSTNFLHNKEEAVYQGLLSFIRECAGERSIVMGLSGGIDSSLSVYLAVQALGKDKVIAVILENSQFTKEGITLAKKFASHLGVKIKSVTIENIRNIIERGVGYTLDYKQQATIDVRICDVIIRTVAQAEDALYMGTINGTERIVGWFPKGALVGDFCPIGGLLKHQLKALATYLKIESFAEGVSQDASIVCGGCGEHEDFKGLPYEELDTILLSYQMGTLENDFIKNYEHREFIPIIIDRISKVEHKREMFPRYCDIINILSTKSI